MSAPRGGALILLPLILRAVITEAQIQTGADFTGLFFSQFLVRMSLELRSVMVGANNWFYQKLDLGNRFQRTSRVFFPFLTRFSELKFFNHCMNLHMRIS